MLGNLIGGFVTILIGVNLLPIIANTVYAATYNGSTGTLNANISGAAVTLTNLVTIFFALAILAIGVTIVLSGLRQAGVM